MNYFIYDLEFALAVPVKTAVSVPVQCILMPGFDYQLKNILIIKILNMLRSENSYTDTQVGSLVACDDFFFFFF